MSIEIPAELQSFVEQELSTGRYQSEQELVRTALEMLRREREEALEGIREGLLNAEQGRVQPLRETFADLRNQRPTKD